MNKIEEKSNETDEEKTIEKSNALLRAFINQNNIQNELKFLDLMKCKNVLNNLDNFLNQYYDYNKNIFDDKKNDAMNKSDAFRLFSWLCVGASFYVPFMLIPTIMCFISGVRYNNLYHKLEMDCSVELLFEKIKPLIEEIEKNNKNYSAKIRKYIINNSEYALLLTLLCDIEINEEEWNNETILNNLINILNSELNQNSNDINELLCMAKEYIDGTDFIININPEDDEILKLLNKK